MLNPAPDSTLDPIAGHRRRLTVYAVQRSFFWVYVCGCASMTEDEIMEP